jgi:hypothetical protein
LISKNNNSLKAESAEILSSLRMANYPNPFRGTTRIEYELPADGNVSLRIYDFSGKEIGTLVNGNKKQGTYYVDFVPNKLSAGVYYYKIVVSTNTNIETQTNKMIIIR